MHLNSQTQQIQSSFAAYCRTGKLHDIPGTDHNRISHYRRLVYNIIDDSLKSAFPITNQLLGEHLWDELVNEFFSNHSCQSPQVWYMPREFYEYILSVSHPLLSTYKFLHELLLMEWLEIELYMMEDILVSSIEEDVAGENKLILNPEHRLVRFNFPVYLKRPSLINAEDKGEYYVVMHREPDSGKIIFTDVSAFYVRIIENLSESPLSFDSLVRKTCLNFGMDTLSEKSTNSTKKFVETAIRNKLILEYQPS